MMAFDAQFEDRSMKRHSEEADRQMWTGMYDQAADLLGTAAAAELIRTAQDTNNPYPVFEAIKNAREGR